MAAAPGKLQGFPFPAPPDMEHKMPRRKAPRELTTEDWKNIKATSRKAVGNRGILESDRPDIEQELAIALWQESPKFNSRQSSWNTYAYHVLEKHLQKIIRSYCQPTARYTRNPDMSLNTLVSDPEYPDWGIEVIEQINEDGLFEDCTSLPEHKGISLKIDIEQFVSRMSPDMQKLCTALKNMQICDAAKKLGISRTTLNERIKIIKNGMIDHGLNTYL